MPDEKYLALGICYQYTEPHLKR